MNKEEFNKSRRYINQVAPGRNVSLCQSSVKFNLHLSVILLKGYLRLHIRTEIVYKVFYFDVYL